jgi:hypothetical protein
MRTVLGARVFLAGVGVLFLLSFALPALGEWPDHFFRGARGIHAFCGALMALGHLSGADDARLVLLGLSALANLFFVCGWVFAVARPLRLGYSNAVALMAWGVFSLVLALLPLFCVGPKNLVIGYYLWVLAIGLLTGWLWYAGTAGESTDRGPTADRPAV